MHPYPARPHVLPRSARITLIDSAPLQAARDWAPAPPPNEVAPDGIAWDNRVVSLAEENRMWLQGELLCDRGCMRYVCAGSRPFAKLHASDSHYLL